MLLTVFETHSPSKGQELYKRFNIGFDEPSTSSSSGNPQHDPVQPTGELEEEYLQDDVPIESSNDDTQALEQNVNSSTGTGLPIKHAVLVNKKTGAVYSPLVGNYGAMSSTPVVQSTDLELIHVDNTDVPNEEATNSNSGDTILDSSVNYLFDPLVRLFYLQNIELLNYLAILLFGVFLELQILSRRNTRNWKKWSSHKTTWQSTKRL